VPRPLLEGAETPEVTLNIGRILQGVLTANLDASYRGGADPTISGDEMMGQKLIL
jgi:hypothetical protein